jgi:hypothetical protein
MITTHVLLIPAIMQLVVFLHLLSAMMTMHVPQTRVTLLKDVYILTVPRIVMIITIVPSILVIFHWDANMLLLTAMIITSAR